MEQRISLVTLGVKDLAASRDFYRRLGWNEAPASNADVAFYQAGGVVLGLFARDALADDAAVAPEGSGFRGITLAHNVRTKEDVARCLDGARAAGAVIVREAEDVFWGGHRGYFADPDGHLWEVAWNPFFPMGEDGIVRLPKA